MRFRERDNSLDSKGRTFSLWHLFTGQAEHSTVSVKRRYSDSCSWKVLVDKLLVIPSQFYFWSLRAWIQCVEDVIPLSCWGVCCLERAIFVVTSTRGRMFLTRTRRGAEKQLDTAALSRQLIACCVALYTRKRLSTSLWSMAIQRSFVSSVTSTYLTTRDHPIGSCNGLVRDAVYDLSSIRE
jgi:hypothetical protein